MAAKKFLAFDLGAESGRAIAGILENGKLTLDVLHRFPTGGIEVCGSLMWDQLGIFRELCKGLNLYVTKYGAQLDGIATDSWGVDFGLLDRNGQMLANATHYRDRRTEGVPEKFFAVIPQKEFMGLTGIQLMSFNTVYQLFAMRRKQQHLLDNAETLLLIADLQNYFFSGAKVAEYTAASTTQMLDCRARDWAKPVLEKAGIPTRLLPDVVPPCSVVGELRPELAAMYGVNPGTPVIAAAGHDTAAAIAAVPAAGGDDWLYLSSGTWSLLGAELPEPLVNEKTVAYNFTNEGGVDNTIRFLKNIMGMWLIQECKRQWEREGENLDYAAITEMAKNAAPFTAVIDPNSSDFFTPGDMPKRIQEFCRKTGQKVPQGKGEIVRTALESLALIYRFTAEQIGELTGKTYRTLHIIGGGTQNKLLNQFTADASGMTVVTGPVEATAMGNCLMQAVARGVIGSLAEARAIVRNSCETETFTPAANRDAWEKAYAKFKEVRGAAIN